MKTIRLTAFACLLIAPLLLAGCLAAIPLVESAAGAGVMAKQYHDSSVNKSDADLLTAKENITSKFRNNPDTDAWYDQRQKISEAVGDRIFDKDFSRVFDSLVVAVSSLELKVTNMERESGYIEASGITLPPADAKAMRKQAVADWCKVNGFDSAVLDQPFKTSAYQQTSDMIDTSSMMATYDKMLKSLTFQLIKMSDTQTKVKLRFSDVYYPTEVEAYYKMVWQAVDKQIFVDQNTEGAVEKRN